MSLKLASSDLIESGLTATYVVVGDKLFHEKEIDSNELKKGAVSFAASLGSEVVADWLLPMLTNSKGQTLSKTVALPLVSGALYGAALKYLGYDETNSFFQNMIMQGGAEVLSNYTNKPVRDALGVK